MSVNYIYLIQEYRFVKTNKNIYKLGMTRQNNLEGVNQYPKGSILLLQTICNNGLFVKNKILQLFKNNFIHRKDIGNDYFECEDYEDMITMMYPIIRSNNTINISNDLSDVIDDNAMNDDNVINEGQ